MMFRAIALGSALLLVLAADVAAFRAASTRALRSNSFVLNRCLSCPDLSSLRLRPQRRESAMASLTATIACNNEVQTEDPVAAAAARAAKAKLTARAQKLIGKPVPEGWEDGNEYAVNESSEFGLMEVVVVRGKFARVHIGPGKDGMFHVETSAGNLSNRGSHTFRSLGPSIIAKLRSQVPTHTSKPYVHPGGDFYTPYNKPWAVDRWLQETKPTEDIIMIVDPDCMFVKKMDIVVEEGSPIAQQAFYNFDFEKNDVPMQIARRYCHNCTFLDPIAVPIIIHRHDIIKIAPKWLEKTIEIRKDMASWPNSWSNRTASPVGLSWTAEMFGYVFAASELGIRHEIWDLQNVPPVHTELFTSIIHYHVEVPLPDGSQWWKHTDNAGYKIPWPLPKGTSQLTTLLLTKLHEAFVKLGRTNHTWSTPNQYVAEV